MPTQQQTKKPIAEGVWLLFGGAFIKAVIIAKKIAETMLSNAAKARGDVEGDTLIYPESDGRASIPILELSQKGYIEMTDFQIKEHLNRLIKLVPDYLKERGLLHKYTETIQDKAEKEHNEYLGELKYMKIGELSSRSKELNEMQRIKDYFFQNDIPNKNLGLLLNDDNYLLGAIRYKAYRGDFEGTEDVILTKSSIKNAVESYSEELSHNKELVKASLEPFSRELEVAKKNNIQSVTFTIKMPYQDPKEITMSTKEFYRHLDTAMLDRFSKSQMPDFLSIDYYGNDGAKLFEEIRAKRFCADLINNFKDYSTDKETGYLMTVDKVSTEKFIENKYEGLENRVILKQYVEATYVKPDTAVSAIKSYFENESKMINDVQKILAPEPEQPAAKDSQPLPVNEERQEIESHENDTIKPHAEEDILSHLAAQVYDDVNLMSKSSVRASEKPELSNGSEQTEDILKAEKSEIIETEHTYEEYNFEM